jgi:hypothetical protein
MDEPKPANGRAGPLAANGRAEPMAGKGRPERLDEPANARVSALTGKQLSILSVLYKEV